MRFGAPQMLWVLAVTAPLLAWFLWWSWRRKQLAISQFVQSRLLAQLTVGISQLRQKARLVLLGLAVACVILALARPQWGFNWEEARQRGLDIVVAIDTSRSMLAEDIRPNRLKRAKLAALDLLKLARHDRLALVAFAGDAFLQCPLTLDEDAFRQSVNALDVGIIPQGGTALTAAIETALTAYKDEGDNFKILVLLTDGEDHENGAVEAAKKASAAGMQIFTVGVGTPNGELLRQTDENGAVSYIKDDQGNVVKSRLDEELLREIATAARGSYLPLRAANAVETLYREELEPLPKKTISARLVQRFHERYQWPLGLAVALLLAEMFLPERKRVARTEAILEAPNAELRKAVAAVAVLLAPLALQASPGSALRQYESGQYRDAQKEFQKLLEKKPDDARLRYDAGAAAFRAGEFDEASKHFSEAANAPDLPLQQRAYYNLGDALYRSGEKTADAGRKAEQWQNAVKQFESAWKLDPQDADAKHNLEFVKKKLEELNQQQSKQDQQQNPAKNDKNDKEDKDPKGKQDEPKNQPKQPEQKPQQKPDPSKAQPADSKPQDQKPEEKPKSKPDENPGGQQPDQREQARQDNRPGGDEEANPQASPVPDGQMTVQQAQQLLDSQKGDEQALIFVPERKPDSRSRIFKDW
jgi:Ca-activated chloride channel family protein